VKDGNSADEKKKGGRPTKDLKRELRVTARFSKLEHYLLQQKAGEAGINEVL